MSLVFIDVQGNGIGLIVSARNELPSYRTFVFAMAFWFAIGASACLTSLSTILASLIIVFIWELSYPTTEEFLNYGVDWVAISLFTAVWLVMLVVQHDRWVRLFKAQPEQPRRVPRPIIARNVNEMAHNQKSMAVGRREYLPPTNHHYAALYRSLERNDWKITRKALTVSVAEVPAFTSLSEKYNAIVSHWRKDMEWITEGYLNEKGQADFIDLAGGTL